jgi:hypothetical protein
MQKTKIKTKPPGSITRKPESHGYEAMDEWLSVCAHLS